MSTVIEHPTSERRALRPLGRNDQLIRAATAAISGEARVGGADAILRSYGDRGVEIVHRAATSPASLSSSEWAGLLASTAVSDFIGGLAPVSAAAQLIGAGLRVELGRASGVRVPGIIASGSTAAFIAEGQPIPVYSLALSGPTLTPFKCASIVVFTRETARSTAIDAAARTALNESVGLSLDSAILSTAAATDDAPAGIRNGAASVTATAGGGDNAMRQDLAKLAAAVAGVGGTNLIFIAAPGEYVKLAFANPVMPFRIYPSAALAAGTVMAVAANALAFAADPVPDFSAGVEAVLHYEDAAPEHISTPGVDPDPATVAAPVRSAWQSDVITLRLILGISWALRAPASQSVATVSSVTW